MSRSFRTLLRLAEALALSVLAGLFVWVVPALFLGTYVPIVCAAGLGLLAGGAVTLRTLGVEIDSRRARVAAAIVCAAAGYAAMQSMEYGSFLDVQRRWERVEDYAASPGEIDARIAARLRASTGGFAGPAGYGLLALGEGVPVLGHTLRGPLLALFWLAELTVAATVAAAWAAGPRPAARAGADAGDTHAAGGE